MCILEKEAEVKVLFCLEFQNIVVRGGQIIETR